MISKIIVSSIFLFSVPVLAGEFRILEPKQVYIDAYNNDTVHDPYLYPVDQKLGIGSTFNVDLYVLKYNAFNIHWNNQLHFDQNRDTGRIVHAGWQYELGSTIFTWNNKSKIELFRQHHSRHILEDVRDTHFPVYDRTGIRFNLLQ